MIIFFPAGLPASARQGAWPDEWGARRVRDPCPRRHHGAGRLV